MANARKVRDRKFPQTTFEISLTDAVTALMRARDIAPGDQWSFFVRGDVLEITRTRTPEEVPVEPDGVTIAGK